jgi:hypothetical protein
MLSSSTCDSAHACAVLVVELLLLTGQALVFRVDLVEGVSEVAPLLFKCRDEVLAGSCAASVFVLLYQ